MAVFDCCPLPHCPFDFLRKLQTVYKPEANPFIALYYDFINQLAEQLPIKGFQIFRPIRWNSQKLPCFGQGIVPILLQERFFLPLGLAELLRQLVTLEFFIGPRIFVLTPDFEVVPPCIPDMRRGIL